MKNILSFENFINENLDSQDLQKDLDSINRNVLLKITSKNREKYKKFLRNCKCLLVFCPTLNVEDISNNQILGTFPANSPTPKDVVVKSGMTIIFDEFDRALPKVKNSILKFAVESKAKSVIVIGEEGEASIPSSIANKMSILE